jgi:hypothetical protein
MLNENKLFVDLLTVNNLVNEFNDKSILDFILFNFDIFKKSFILRVLEFIVIGLVIVFELNTLFIVEGVNSLLFLYKRE